MAKINIHLQDMKLSLKIMLYNLRIVLNIWSIKVYFFYSYLIDMIFKDYPKIFSIFSYKN